MSVEQYLRVPLKIGQLIRLPRGELRNYNLYVEQDVDYFDDDTTLYLDDCIEEDMQTGEEIYPPFSLQHHLQWAFFGTDMADVVMADAVHPPSISKTETYLENFNYFGTIRALTLQFPQAEISDDELSYIAAGDFARHLLQLFADGNRDELVRGLDFIERLHHSKYQKVRELATIGYLEDIQNVWGNNSVDPELIYCYLGAESKKWWVELNQFWNGEITFVGESYRSGD